MTSNFPKDLKLDALENVRCLALNLCAAVMECLIIAIKRNQRGKIRKCQLFAFLTRYTGNVVTSICEGSNKLPDAIKKVSDITNSYTSALVELGTSLGVKTWEEVQGLSVEVENLERHVQKIAGASFSLYCVILTLINNRRSRHHSRARTAGNEPTIFELVVRLKLVSR